MSETSFALEQVRQQCITFKKAEKQWKKNTPKGKKYVGFKFVPFKRKSANGWTGMGYEVKPVYKITTISQIRG